MPFMVENTARGNNLKLYFVKNEQMQQRRKVFLRVLKAVTYESIHSGGRQHAIVSRLLFVYLYRMQPHTASVKGRGSAWSEGREQDQTTRRRQSEDLVHVFHSLNITRCVSQSEHLVDVLHTNVLVQERASSSGGQEVSPSRKNTKYCNLEVNAFCDFIIWGYL